MWNTNKPLTGRVALVPACALVLAAVLVRSDYVEHDLLRPLLEFVVLITSLQIGYVSGPLSCVIPGIWQRFKKPLLRAPSRPATIAAARHRS